MITETIKYYNNNAETLCEKYDSVDFLKIQQSISSYLVNAKQILEIGSGSGRDANYMIANGFNVTGIDGSINMIEKAIKHYPLLRGKLIHAILPEDFPKFEKKFDGLYSLGTLMHFNKDEINDILNNVNKVLEPKSPVYISVSNVRNNVDDRFFNALDKKGWVEIFKENNFIIRDVKTNCDVSGRDIIWYSFLMETRGKNGDR